MVGSGEHPCTPPAAFPTHRGSHGRPRPQHGAQGAHARDAPVAKCSVHRPAEHLHADHGVQHEGDVGLDLGDAGLRGKVPAEDRESGPVGYKRTLSMYDIAALRRPRHRSMIRCGAGQETLPPRGTHHVLRQPPALRRGRLVRAGGSHVGGGEGQRGGQRANQAALHGGRAAGVGGVALGVTWGQGRHGVQGSNELRVQAIQQAGRQRWSAWHAAWHRGSHGGAPSQPVRPSWTMQAVFLAAPHLEACRGG